MITPISWPLALQELGKLLPGCTALLPDAIAEAARKAGHSVHFVPLNGWESMNDEAVFQMILPGELKLREAMIIVTEASFSKATPFSLHRGDLPEFLQFHFRDYNECAINGDTIILLPEHRMIVIFHHEGVFSVIEVGR